MRRNIFLITLLTIACTGDGKTENNNKTTEPAVRDVKASISKDKLKEIVEAGQAEELLLVPSPAEMQRTIKNANLTTQLNDLVDSSKTINVKVEDLDEVAVRTGVIIAKMLLTVEKSTDEKILDQFSKLKEGFSLLKAGTDINDTIDDMVSRIKTKQLDRANLVIELDWLSGAMISELEYETGGWVVPLIQAGSWLKGSNLVASAIVNESKFDVADRVLRQPNVVKYFKRYVKREGRSKAPDAVVQKLITTLDTLHDITKKPKLSEEDVKTIKTITNDVLDLL